MVPVDVDALMEASELDALEHAGRHAERQGVRAGERTVQELRGHVVHGAMSP